MLPSKLRRKLSGICWAKEVAARLKPPKRLESGIRREPNYLRLLHKVKRPFYFTAGCGCRLKLYATPNDKIGKYWKVLTSFLYFWICACRLACTVGSVATSTQFCPNWSHTWPPVRATVTEGAPINAAPTSNGKDM